MASRTLRVVNQFSARSKTESLTVEVHLFSGGSYTFLTQPHRVGEVLTDITRNGYAFVQNGRMDFIPPNNIRRISVSPRDR